MSHKQKLMAAISTGVAIAVVLATMAINHLIYDKTIRGGVSVIAGLFVGHFAARVWQAFK